PKPASQVALQIVKTLGGIVMATRSARHMGGPNETRCPFCTYITCFVCLSVRDARVISSRLRHIWCGRGSGSGPPCRFLFVFHLSEQDKDRIDHVPVGRLRGHSHPASYLLHEYVGDRSVTNWPQRSGCHRRWHIKPALCAGPRPAGYSSVIGTT